MSLTSDETLTFEDSTFDNIVSFDVFEHLKNSDKHLSEVSRILKPKGHYLLQTLNKWTNTIFETVTWKSFTKWRENHCSVHSYFEIQKRFKKHNFEVTYYKIPVVNDFFRLKIKNYLGGSELIALKIFDFNRLPIPLRTNSYLKAVKF